MIPEGDELRHGAQVTAEDLVRGSIRLMVLPEVFIELNRLIEDPNSTAAAFAGLISRDPALSARLLRIANSPFYGFPSKINTVPRAVTVIGSRGLRDLVLAASSCDLFSRFGDELIDKASFWNHSLFCGLAARLLGLRCGISEAESLFVTGLLHDIGQLVILYKLPEMGRQTQLRSRDSGVRLDLLEKSVIGCDHAEVGGELLRQWSLPVEIWEPVRFHHDSAHARHAPLNASIVHIADIVADQYCSQPAADSERLLSRISAEVATPVMDLLECDERMLEELQEEILLQLDGISSAMLAA